MIKRIIPLVLICTCIALKATAQVDTVYKGQPVSKYFKQSIAPVALIGFGMYMKLNKTGFNDLSVKDKVVSNYPNFHTSADDYLRFASVPFIYGLDWVGVKAKTDIKNRTAILIKAEVIMFASTTLLKNGTHVMRPDGSNDKSFPSGHTAQAFLGAVMIQREYGHRSVWYPIAAYTVATSVGVLRVMNNRHYTSDVFVGAGIGMLSAHIAYWTHQYKWNKNVVVMPTYSNRAAGVYFAMTF
ncbi:phosphatase PAP2 family protein [Cytophaga aurantiaca]|uniref:phosphatase PAP2 family protein n=1 Tax=Cytophaga aurantiaca TaxID=29530 RepID=UPI0003722B6A|nr:phosphatase PAP2 family protein [Cytophaga aurantiaca]